MHKPLLLVENIEEQTNAMDAISAGSPARSWLGVPMLSAGEAIGAIIVQDSHQEHRFDEGDQNLLVTLATQVAAAARNARLLESTQRQAAQERQIGEITSRMRESLDVEAVLQTAMEEIYQTLNLDNLVVQLLPSDDQSDKRWADPIGESI